MEEVLRTRYVSTPTATLAAEIGLTEQECRSKASKMGLKKPADNSRNPFSRRLVDSAAPIGSYRIAAHGHLHQKISEEPGPQNRRWQPVHRLVWIAANGAVPEGRVVTFKSGRMTTDPAQITLDALECITREESMARNSIHQYGPEVASVSQLCGAITRQINKRTKEKA